MHKAEKKDMPVPNRKRNAMQGIYINVGIAKIRHTQKTAPGTVNIAEIADGIWTPESGYKTEKVYAEALRREWKQIRGILPPKRANP